MLQTARSGVPAPGDRASAGRATQTIGPSRAPGDASAVSSAVAAIPCTRSASTTHATAPASPTRRTTRGCPSAEWLSSLVTVSEIFSRRA